MVSAARTLMEAFLSPPLEVREDPEVDFKEKWKLHIYLQPPEKERKSLLLWLLYQKAKIVSFWLPSFDT